MNWLSESGWTPPQVCRISAFIYYSMRRHILACLPEEGCGLLAADSVGRVRRHFPIENFLHSGNRFQLHPQQMVNILLGMEESRFKQLVIYHSHPSGPSHLSQTDLAESYYPEALHLLWFPVENRWKTKVFYISEGSPIEIKMEITK